MVPRTEAKTAEWAMDSSGRLRGEKDRVKKPQQQHYRTDAILNPMEQPSGRLPCEAYTRIQ
jgi:hypothetical protein